MITATDFDNAGLYAPPQQKARDDLGQEDFLTLMITQFQNQDPFKPMENGEFLGQLAQFSTVNGIESLNSGFSGLSGALQDEQALQAANLVGRSVLAVSNTGHFDGSTPMAGGIELGASASNVQVDITDSSGELLRRINLGQQDSGFVEFSWDGLDADGDLVDSGHYQVSARVIRGANTESSPVAIRSTVDSVTLGGPGGQMTLNIGGGGRLSLAQIYQIG
jgi:flagellar basal-body rod modification protein FlgD